jgi:hypothetical protein
MLLSFSPVILGQVCGVVQGGSLACVSLSRRPALSDPTSRVRGVGGCEGRVGPDGLGSVWGQAGRRSARAAKQTFASTTPTAPSWVAGGGKVGDGQHSEGGLCSDVFTTVCRGHGR